MSTDDARLYELEHDLARLQSRVELLEQRQIMPTLPHVVLGPDQVLVLTGPPDMDPAQYARLHADVKAMGLGGRVVVIGPELQPAIDQLCRCGSGSVTTVLASEQRMRQVVEAARAWAAAWHATMADPAQTKAPLRVQVTELLAAVDALGMAPS